MNGGPKKMEETINSIMASSTTTATTWDMSKKSGEAAESMWNLTAKMGSTSTDTIVFESTVKHWKTQNVRYDTLCTTTFPMCNKPPATRHKDRCVQSTMSGHHLPGSLVTGVGCLVNADGFRTIAFRRREAKIEANRSSCSFLWKENDVGKMDYCSTIFFGLKDEIV